MQFITRLLFQYNLSTSLMTLISVFLTWLPLVVLGLLYLTQKAQFSQEKQGRLFSEFALLSALLLGAHGLLFGRQVWQLWHDAAGQALYWPMLNALESASVYLALPSGFVGLFCGFLLFDSTWNFRKFWIGFWSYTGLALMFLAGHLVLPYSSFDFVQLELVDMLSIWSSYYLVGIPLVLCGIASAAIFSPGIFRPAGRTSTAALKSKRSGFAH